MSVAYTLGGGNKGPARYGAPTVSRHRYRRVFTGLVVGTNRRRSTGAARLVTAATIMAEVDDLRCLDSINPVSAALRY